MKNFYYKNKIYLELLIWLIVFGFISYYFTVNLANDWANSILATSGFVFAIVLAFSVANRKQRLDEIRMTLRQNDALYVKVAETAKSFSTKEAENIKNKIDDLLVSQIDYFLCDIEYTTPKLIDLLRAVEDLDVSNNDLLDVKIMLIDTVSTILENHKKVIYYVNDKMRRVEWISLYSLALVMLLMLNSMNTGTLLATLIITLLSTSIVVLFIVLREINNLAWLEYTWIWNPLIDVFHELDLLPYLPSDLTETRGITFKRLKPMKAYRRAIYPDPYPNFETKQIEIIKL